MSENFHFDDFVKNSLGNSSAKVPDKIWQNIVATRRTSKLRPFLWFPGKVKYLFTLIVLVSVTIISLILLGTKSKHKDHISKKTSEINSTTPPNLVHDQEKPEGYLGSSLQNSSDRTQHDASDPNSHINALNQAYTKTRAFANSKGLTSTSRPLPSVTSIKPIYDTPEVTPETLQSPDTKFEKLVIKHGELQDEAGHEDFLGKPNLPSRAPFLLNSSSARELSAFDKLTLSGNKLVGCPTLEQNAAGNKKYWELYAGPDHIFNNYRTLGDTASVNYLQRRKASTTMTSAYSAGIRYTRVFDNGMSARIGVNYSQRNERFNYVNPNELKFITVITRRVVVRAPGDTLYFSDTLQYQQSGTHVKTTYNHYRNIDIPVVIGYELGNGRIHTNINAGVIINVYSWYKGDILDTTYQPVTITTGKGTSNYQYKTNIGVGFLGSVSLYYKLNSTIHLLLEPYFRYNLSPVSKENLNLQQKYHTIGLRTGIRVDLH